MSQEKCNKKIIQNVSLHFKPYDKWTLSSLSPNVMIRIKQISHEIKPFLKSDHCVQLHLFHMTKVSIQIFYDWQCLRKLTEVDWFCVICNFVVMLVYDFSWLSWFVCLWDSSLKCEIGAYWLHLLGGILK